MSSSDTDSDIVIVEDVRSRKPGLSDFGRRRAATTEVEEAYQSESSKYSGKRHSREGSMVKENSFQDSLPTDEEPEAQDTWSQAGSSRSGAGRSNRIRENMFEGRNGPISRIEILGDSVIRRLGDYAAGHESFKLVRESVHYDRPSNVRDEIARIYRLLHKKGRIFGIARHGEPFEHFHIFHLCPWQWYCCRCYPPGSGGRRRLQTTSIRTVSASNWYSLLQYYSTGPRELQYLYDGNATTTAVHGIKLIFNSHVYEPRQSYKRPLEVGESSNQDCIDSGPVGEDTGSNRFSLPQRNVRHFTIKSVRNPEEIEKFILKHPVSPLQNITKSTVWLGSTYKYLGNNDKMILIVLNAIRSKLCHWRIEDYVAYYKTTKPWFQALNGNIPEHYLSLKDSKKYITDLIEMQMGDLFIRDGTVEDGLADFWTNVYKILNRTNDKINTIELIGPPSCGKTYFANFICDFFLAVGHIENFTRQNSFPLQSAYNSRILHWNEAQCEPSKLEDAKKILGGDPCSANIKYHDTQTITKTPVIITANQQHIPNNEAFRVRMLRYKWRDIGLSDQSMKPANPLALIDILRDYTLID